MTVNLLIVLITNPSVTVSEFITLTQLSFHFCQLVLSLLALLVLGTHLRVLLCQDHLLQLVLSLDMAVQR